MGKIVFLVWVCIVLNGWGAEKLQKIVVASSTDPVYAHKILDKLTNEIGHDKEIQKLQRSFEFKILSRPSGKYHIVSIEPFSNEMALKKVYRVVHNYYPDAFINKYDLMTAPKQIKASNNNLSKSIVPVVHKELPKPIGAKELDNVEVKSKITPQYEFGVEENDEALFNEGWTNVFFMMMTAVFATLFLIRQRQYTLQTRSMRELKMTIGRKELFMAKISHELRAPLNAIIGLSHLLAQSGLTRHQSIELENIRRSGKMAGQIIEDILDFSKIESGAMSIDNSPFNLNDMLDNVSGIVSEKANAKKLELIFDIDQRIPNQLMGDSLRLSQILINLINNAIKFTEEGNIILTAKKIKSVNSAMVIEWSVSDTGIGLKPTQINDIFKLYTQAEKSTARLYGGTGLGLSIAKELVELMGGTIRVESEYGRGSTFIFTVTIELMNPNDIRTYRLESNHLMMRKRALIVDSNLKAMNTLRKMLKYFHYTSFVVTSVDEVLTWEGDLFDILFINEHLLDERSIAKLKSFKTDALIPIVLMGDLEIYDENKNGSCVIHDYYLTKPITPKQVFEAIQVVFAHALGDTPKRTMVKEENLKDRLKALAGSRILLAEDNDINQRVLNGLLEGSGIEVVTAENGREAIQILQGSKKSFDLILMDIEMPEMDGYEATQLIRMHKSFDNISIVALTGKASEEDRKAAFDVGMDEVLTKPINVRQFYATLLHFIGPRFGVYVDESPLK